MKFPSFFYVLAALAIWGVSFSASAQPQKVSDGALRQIRALHDEKESRTPAQQKMDSQLIYAAKQNRGQAIAANVPLLKHDVKIKADGRVLVDITANVTEKLLQEIRDAGGEVVNSHPQFRSIRALVPLAKTEALAVLPNLNFIRPADECETRVGSLNSEGDNTHAAGTARTNFGVNGGGIKVGVLSDSVDGLATSQASGDLGTVTVLAGQSGSGSGEGTAMLEIIHDLAPGASLYFATAFNGQSSFAQNILDLRAAGCDIIVDDVGYFAESPFQDGVIAQAVNTITTGGGMYFSSAGNSGNKNDGTSGTWEGDFVDGGAAGSPVNGKGGNIHDFGGGTTFNTVAAGGSSRRVDLFWSDPLGGSSNDYDVYVLDSTGTSVLRSSTTTQSGTQDPYESISTLNVGERIVIVKASGAARFLHLETGRGRLTISTSGNTHGHNSATNAYCVAATSALNSSPNAFTGGGANPVETFSSDGPRRVFYQANGTAITPGDFSSTGGAVRQKPDITAADGVKTAVSGFNPFYGTSAAAPHAAAVTALLKSYNNSLTTTQIRAALTNTALDIEAAGYDRDAGSGIIMAQAALQSVSPLPALSVSSTSLTGGNGNGAVDPNECNDLTVAVANFGGATASNVTATLSTTTPGVTIFQSNSAYANLSANSTNSNTTVFKISSSPSFICGTAVSLTLTVVYSTGTNVIAFQLSGGTNNYAITTSSGASIVSGSTDIGNHGDDVVTTISLPFAFSYYGQSFTNATLSSNGNLQFSSSSIEWSNSCLASSALNNAIFAHWDDLRTDASGKGIFTSTSGSTPNRIFNIEWRATYFSSGLALGFEIRLYESGPRFDIIYGTLNGTGSGATVGAQKGTGSLVAQFGCNSGVLSNGLQLTFQQNCTDGGGQCSPVMVNFAASPVSGAVPLMVNFTNTTTGGTNFSWTFGDGNTSSATNPANIYNAAGTYTVSLTAIGEVTNILTRTNYIVVTNVPPTISAQPQGKTVLAGSNVLFSVTASGSPAPAYQWRFNTTNISGATASAFTRSNAQPADAGSYTVVITNAGGSVTSTIAMLTVNVPPGITTPPQNLTTNQGQTAPFSVTASGTTPFSYKWRFNGVNISGATTNTFSRTNAQCSDAGSYDVVVTNVAGSVTSGVAMLTIISPPAITAHPQGHTLAQSNSVSFSVTATNTCGGGLTYQWRFNAVNISGATNTGYSRTNLQCADAGSFDVVVANAAGSVTSSVANLIVISAPMISAGPTNGTVNAGSNVTFAITATNQCGNSLTFQWRFNGTDISGATVSNFSRTNTQCSDAGSYDVVVTNVAGSVTSGVAVLMIISAPTITAQPQSQTLAQGSSVSFSVAATNTCGGGLTFQWRFGGADIFGATDSGYSRTNLLCADAGSFDVVVANAAGSVTSSIANLIVISAPMISAEPTNGTVNAGNNVIFAVTATNQCGNSFAFQWRFNGANISGATDSNLSRTNSQCSDAGSYDVIVTNIAGSVTSSVAVLTIISSPTITAHPQGQTVAQGNFISFSVTATNDCGGGLTFQWRFGSANISDATGSSYSQTNLQCADAGSFDVVVANAAGSVTSSVANLVIVSPPVISTQPTNQTVIVGQDATFTASATNDCGGGLAYQWLLNGTNISDATTTSLTRTNAQFVDAGSYSLVTSNLAGSVTSVVATLTVLPPPPVADFVAASLIGLAPLTVHFTNLTSNATGYNWDFGDGNASTNETPVNIFTNAGSYTISLTAIGVSGTNTFTRTNYIIVTNPPPIVTPASLNLGIILTGLTSQANFTVSNVGTAALTVTATLDTPFAILDPTSNAVSNLVFDVPAAGATNVAVRFTSTVDGIFSSAVVFTSVTGNSTNSVTAQTFAPPVILSASASGGEFNFSFATISGLNYTVQYKDSLDDLAWQTFATITGDGSVKILTNSVTTPAQRFFQLKLE